MHTTGMLCFPKNLIPWRDSNPGILVPEAHASPLRHGSPGQNKENIFVPEML
jgi:hypothetical protein